MRQNKCSSVSQSTLFAKADTKVACQQSVVHDQPKLIIGNTFLAYSSKDPLEGAKQDETLDCDWRNISKAPKKYKEYLLAFLEVLKPLQNRCAGYLETINTSTHRIGLTSPYIRSINSAPYHTGRKELES